MRRSGGGKSGEVIDVPERFCTDQCPVKFFKTKFGWILGSQVPFPGEECAIASLLQDLGDRDGFVRDVSLVAALIQIARHVPQTDPMGVLTGHDGSARGTAAARIIKLSQSHSPGSQGIQMGSLDLASKTSQIAVAQIVGDNQQDIGFSLGTPALFRPAEAIHECEQGTDQPETKGRARWDCRH